MTDPREPPLAQLFEPPRPPPPAPLDALAPPPPSRLFDGALATLLALTYGAPALLFVTWGGALVGGAVADAFRAMLAATCGLGGAIALGILLYRHIRAKGRAKAVLAAQVLIVVLLPIWGLGYNHFLSRGSCAITACEEGTTVFRPFAEPEVLGLVAFHALTVFAYALSRRRPAALRPVAEALVHAALLAGIFVHAVTAVHVARWAGVGVALAPVFAPCLAPALTVVLYVAELRSRLRRRGTEADTPPDWQVADSLYRKGPVQQAIPAPPRLHRVGLLRAVALAPVLLGAHAVLHALWLGHATAAASVFTRTCGHVLSSLPVVVTPGECHYLCTVAARGHSWLVRPERLGKRRGSVIVVNRQLAIANAFEDLLHERWPRFGKLARRIYDRLGLPISRYIRRPWLADLTYLAMKPAEWLFALFLLFADRGDPEQRIERMYRG